MLFNFIFLLFIGSTLASPVKKKSEGKYDRNKFYNHKYFEGDILSYASNSLRYHAINSESSLWPNGEVVYTADPSVDYGLISSAMDQISQATGGCIKFREKQDTDTDYVEIFSGEGCFAEVGRKGGLQRTYRSIPNLGDPNNEGGKSILPPMPPIPSLNDFNKNTINNNLKLEKLKIVHKDLGDNDFKLENLKGNSFKFEDLSKKNKNDLKLEELKGALEKLTKKTSKPDDFSLDKIPSLKLSDLSLNKPSNNVKADDLMDMYDKESKRHVMVNELTGQYGEMGNLIDFSKIFGKIMRKR